MSNNLRVYFDSQFKGIQETKEIRHHGLGGMDTKNQRLAGLIASVVRNQKTEQEIESV